MSRLRVLLILCVLAVAMPLVASPASATNYTSFTLTRSSAATPLTGTVVRFTARGASTLAGRTVYLQRAVGSGGWVSVARRTVPSAGHTFSIYGVAAGVGRNTWRLVSALRPNYYVSRVSYTTVYRWYYLHDLVRVDSNRFGADEATIGGTYYSRSVTNSSSYWYDRNAWGEWNLGYLCTYMSATIGLRDDSATGSRVSFSADLDGATTNFAIKGLVAGTPVNLRVASHFRIRLNSDYVSGPLGSGSTSGWGSWGNARILCRAQPAPTS